MVITNLDWVLAGFWEKSGSIYWIQRNSARDKHRCLREHVQSSNTFLRGTLQGVQRDAFCAAIVVRGGAGSMWSIGSHGSVQQ